MRAASRPVHITQFILLRGQEGVRQQFQNHLQPERGVEILTWYLIRI